MDLLRAPPRANRVAVPALLACIAVALLPSASRAQGPVDAAIRGHVPAFCGARAILCPPVSARILLTAASSRNAPAQAREIELDRHGNFLLQRLLPGQYTLTLRSASGDAVTALVLEPGELADVAFAAGSQPAVVLRRQLTAFAVPAEADTLADLPAAAARWENLAALDSQAVPASTIAQNAAPSSEQQDDEDGGQPGRTSGSDGAAASGLSYGGLTPLQGALSVDGLSGDQNFRAGPRGSATGGPSSGSSFTEGALRNLRVLPRTFSAQYGGGGGGLAVVSRTGSDGLHGSAFALARSSSWAATNPFSVETHYHDGVVTAAAVKPSGNLETFGFNLGAPLGLLLPARLAARSAVTRGWQQRVWVFGSLEAHLHSDHIVSTPQTASFYDLSAIQRALLENRGVGSAAINAALDYLDSLSGTTARTAYRVQGFARADAQATSRDRVAVSYAANRFASPAGVALGQASDAVVARGRGSLGDSRVQVDSAAARWLHLFSDTWNNELRAQLAGDLEFETPHAPLAQEPGIGPGGFAPQVSIAPQGFAYGTPAALAAPGAGGRRAYPDEVRFELADSMQLKLGRNLLTLGGDWSRIRDRIDASRNAEGSFSYDSGSTGGKAGGLVDWITDYTFNVNAYPNGACPSIDSPVHYFCFRSFTQTFDAQPTTFITHTLAGFAEDAFRLEPNLTVTVGVRYEYTLLPPPQRPNPDLDTALAGLSLPVNGLSARFPEDRNNFGPRLSAAWSPRRSGSRWAQKDGALLTLHLGYGLFFGRIPGATVQSALTDTALPSTTLRVRIRPSTETLCPQVTAVQQGFGYACDFLATPPSAVAQTTSAVVFAAGYRVPAIQRASLGLERSVGQRALLRLSYATAFATQLPGSTDINIQPAPVYASFVLQGGDGHPGLASGQTFAVPLYTLRRLSQYGPVTALVSNSNATYHAATAEAQVQGLAVRGLHTLELRGSYTFSRAIDYAPQSSAVPGIDSQFDPFHNGYDKGLSNQQYPQRFAGDLIYRTAVSAGPAWLRRAAGGWRAAAIGIAGSGSPYSYEIFGGPYLKGGRESINGSGGATYLPTVGRNTLRLPPRGRVDLRLSRDVRLPWNPAQSGVGNGARLNIFAEAFNLLNSTNVSAVQTRAFLPGTPALAGAPTPLIFQDAATVAAEGLTTTPAFGTPRSSTTGLSRERQVELGLRLSF